MGVVEGHAEHVMDVVGAESLPSLAELRAALDRRRRERPPLLALLERLIGLDAKLRQYEDGKRFCDAVVAAGRAGRRCTACSTRARSSCRRAMRRRLARDPRASARGLRAAPVAAAACTRSRRRRYALRDVPRGRRSRSHRRRDPPGRDDAQPCSVP